jgi:integrase
LARAKAVENAQLVSEGGDPRIPLATIPTFADAVEKVIAIHSENWKDGGKTAKLWRTSLAAYAMSRLGDKLVSEITTANVMAVLVPIWAEKRATAMKVRRRIRAVMQWATAQGHRDDNPAGDAIDGALPKTGQRAQHQRALQFADVGAAIAIIRGTNAWLGTKLAFEFLTLTATRSNEVRLATWAEINGDTATWTIPASRMKGGRDHRIPLSRQAMDVLNQAKELADGTGLVFPSVTGKPLTDNAIQKEILHTFYQLSPSHCFLNLIHVCVMQQLH